MTHIQGSIARCSASPMALGVPLCRSGYSLRFLFGRTGWIRPIDTLLFTTR